jgi:hypothetical protein
LPTNGAADADPVTQPSVNMAASNVTAMLAVSLIDGAFPESAA